MSSASVPSIMPGPAAPPAAPELVRPAPEKPRGGRRWLVIAAAIAAIAGLAWVAKRQPSAAKPETAAVRTATIATGDLERTIRVSGIVAAERFAALMAPQLRGIRGASGAYGSGGAKSMVGNASSSSSSSTSSSTTTGSSTSSSSPSSANGSTSQNSSATSTNTALNGQSAASGAPGAPQSSLGAIRGTQNRFGDRQAGQTAANKPGTNNNANASNASSSLGANGMGSTAPNLIPSSARSGGGPGGGGDSDFALVLVEVAKPGSQVKKGEIVGAFDRQYQLNRLDDYQASVVQLDANVKKLKADQAVAKEAHDQLVRSAKADWDKALLDLKTAEVRSAIEAEDLKLAAEENDARYKQLAEESKLLDSSQRAELLAAEIDRNQAKIELDRATMNVNRMVARAPMDGIVVMQTIWRGGDFGQVQQGDQIWPGQTFMQIVDPSSMVIMANLNQADAESVRLGLKATARLDAYPGAGFPAHVIGVGAMTKPGVWRPNYMREIPVRLKLEHIDARVIPDISASADIVVAVEKHATLAPQSAVFRDGGANPFVFLQTPAGWQRREVEVGLRNHVAVVVRSGVSPGDVVATERPATVRPPS